MKYDEKKFKILKDKYIKCWIVWERVGKSAYNDIHHDKTKKECKKWLSTL